MKYVFFDCDVCFYASTPSQTDMEARSKAIEEGFVFLKGKCYCRFHTPNEDAADKICLGCGNKMKDHIDWGLPDPSSNDDG